MSEEPSEDDEILERLVVEAEGRDLEPEEVVEEAEDVDDESLQEQIWNAIEAWEDGLMARAEKWQKKSSESEDSYRKGVANFLGVDEDDVSKDTSGEWQRNISAVNPEEYRDAVKGRGPEWFLGIYRGMTGEEPPMEMVARVERLRRLREMMDEEEEQ